MTTWGDAARQEISLCRGKGNIGVRLETNEDVQEHSEDDGGDERENQAAGRAAVDADRFSRLVTFRHLGTAFLRGARRGLELLVGLPLATSPVGSFKRPAFTRSFSAISAISSGA
jgi:hypothetical protein